MNELNPPQFLQLNALEQNNVMQSKESQTFVENKVILQIPQEESPHPNLYPSIGHLPILYAL